MITAEQLSADVSALVRAGCKVRYIKNEDGSGVIGYQVTIPEHLTAEDRDFIRKMTERVAL